MDKIERALDSIVDKDAMHRLIEELPEGAKAILISRSQDGSNTKMKYFGDMYLVDIQGFSKYMESWADYLLKKNWDSSCS
jgi:hypothetical protein